jgi:hypothetical protein
MAGCWAPSRGGVSILMVQDRHSCGSNCKDLDLSAGYKERETTALRK